MYFPGGGVDGLNSFCVVTRFLGSMITLGGSLEPHPTRKIKIADDKKIPSFDIMIFALLLSL